MNRFAHILRTNAIGLIALFFALGGTAVAAGGLITGDKIAPETITGANILNGSVTGSDVALNTITGTNIADQSLGIFDLGKDSVSSHQISSSAVAADELADGSVGLYKLNIAGFSKFTVGMIAPGTCTTVTANGLPANALTFASSSPSNTTAVASASDGSGSATVRVCNNSFVWVNPNLKLYGLRP